MRRFVLALLIALTCSWSAGLAPAQTTQPADSLRVYLVTIGPGKEVWERFGHNMIWIHDPAAPPTARDTYNWGMFDFDNFIPNFLSKNMRYWMDAYPAGLIISDYIDADRSVWLHELNLTQAQKERLRTNLEINRWPENKFYDYDYYTDNCSTRVRDALDRVLDGSIRRQLEPVDTETTFRYHTRRLLADDYAADLSLDYVEGPYVDRHINRWEESFLPVKFMRHLQSFTTPAGPMLLSERTLHVSQKYPEREVPPNRLAPYLIIGIVLGAAMLPFAFIRNRWLRLAPAAVMFTWCAVGAFGSVIMLFLWLATPHLPPARNENVLLLNPLFFVPLVLLPLLKRASRLAMISGLIIAGLSILALLIQILPSFNQVNGDFIALTLPANLGLAAALFLAHRLRRQALAENPEPYTSRKPLAASAISAIWLVPILLLTFIAEHARADQNRAATTQLVLTGSVRDLNNSLSRRPRSPSTTATIRGAWTTRSSNR